MHACAPDPSTHSSLQQEPLSAPSARIQPACSWHPSLPPTESATCKSPNIPSGPSTVSCKHVGVLLNPITVAQDCFQAEEAVTRWRVSEVRLERNWAFLWVPRICWCLNMFRAQRSINFFFLLPNQVPWEVEHASESPEKLTLLDSPLSLTHQFQIL